MKHRVAETLVPVSCKIPRSQAKKLDLLVKKNGFASRSEAIRELIRTMNSNTYRG